MAGCEGGGGGEEVVEEFGAGGGGEVCSEACVEGGREGGLAGRKWFGGGVIVVIIAVVVVLFVLFFFNGCEVLLMIQWRYYLGAIDDLPARYSRSSIRIVRIWSNGRRDRSRDGEKEGHEKPEPGVGLGHCGVCMSGVGVGRRCIIEKVK